MRDSLEIVLFFEKNSFYNPTKIASMINDKIKDIGAPIILPINTEAPVEANIPILLFNQNKKINIVSNFQNVSITLFDDMIDKDKDIIDIIMDIFWENKIVRMGIIINNVLREDIYKQIKNETKCNDEVLNSKDFKISWLNEIEINDTKINVWKNYFSNKTKTTDILRILDFNTKIEEKLEIDKKFVLSFIEECKKNI